MKTNHTPGKWEFVHTNTSPYTKKEWHSVVQMPNNIALSILNVKYNMSKEETEANAKLIAAAPELLEACKSAMNDTIMLQSGECEATQENLLATKMCCLQQLKKQLNNYENF